MFNRVLNTYPKCTTQLPFTCSKLKIETLEQGFNFEHI